MCEPLLLKSQVRWKKPPHQTFQAATHPRPCSSAATHQRLRARPKGAHAASESQALHQRFWTCTASRSAIRSSEKIIIREITRNDTKREPSSRRFALCARFTLFLKRVLSAWSEAPKSSYQQQNCKRPVISK